jgi:hypothetical protein
MHYLRQHSQLFATLVMTALLSVWLGYSCQHCFAADLDESAANMHAMMDCCPTSTHADQAPADSEGCQNNASLELPVISVDHTFGNMEKLAFVFVSEFFIDTWDHPQPASPDYYPPNQPLFSDRNFTSYRILLI